MRALVLPAEVAALPDVGEAVAAEGLRGGLFEAVLGAPGSAEMAKACQGVCQGVAKASA